MLDDTEDSVGQSDTMFPIDNDHSCYAAVGQFVGWLLIRQQWRRVIAAYDIATVAEQLKREGDRQGVPVEHRQVRDHPRNPMPIERS